MNICDGADELREYSLDLINGQRAMAQKVIVEFVTRTVFQHQPDQLLRHDNFIKASDVGVEELAMVMDFTD